MTTKEIMSKSDARKIAEASVKLLFIRLNPFSSQEKYNNKLRELMDGFNARAFEYHIPEIIGMLRFNKKISKKYPNTYLEVADILKAFPRLNRYRNILQNVVNEHRGRFGLTVSGGQKLDKKTSKVSQVKDIMKQVPSIGSTGLGELLQKGVKLPMKMDVKDINGFISGLSEDTFNKVAPIIIMNVEISREKAVKCKNGEEQIKPYFEKYPRMKQFENILLERVNDQRKKWNLLI